MERFVRKTIIHTAGGRLVEVRDRLCGRIYLELYNRSGSLIKRFKW